MARLQSDLTAPPALETKKILFDSIIALVTLMEMSHKTFPPCALLNKYFKILLMYFLLKVAVTCPQDSY